MSMSTGHDNTMAARATVRLLFRMRRHSGAARSECLRAALALGLPRLMALRSVLRSVI